MPQRPITPGGVELFGSYSKHLGPRFSGAGLGIQFRYNAPTGIHFETEVPEEFRDDIIRGVQDAMAIRFPDFPLQEASGSRGWKFIRLSHQQWLSIWPLGW